MAVKIRLRQQGRTNRPFYRLVVTDSRHKRDGKYVDTLGWYNPMEQKEELTLFVDSAKVQSWLERGAQLSECAEQLVKKMAPQVMKEYQDKKNAKRVRLAAKKRQRRKKQAAA